MTPQAPEGFAFRPPQAGDAAFLIKSWLQSSERLHVSPSGMRRDRYYATFHDVVAKALQTKQVLICCVEDRQDIIAGFAVFDAERQSVLYVYVKQAFRRAGMAAAMLAALGFSEGWSVGVVSAPWQIGWRRAKGADFVPWELSLI